MDSIIAVKDVRKSAKWYKDVLNLDGIHHGDEFEILVNHDREVMLCLHKWGEHNHPTLMDAEIVSGNGLILYFRTTELDEVKTGIDNLGFMLEKDIMLNPNSHKRELSLKDLDGYYLSISEYHEYQG